MFQRMARRYRCNRSADECRQQATSGGCQQITDHHRRRLQQTTGGGCNRPPAAVATSFGADVEAASLPRRESRRRRGAALHAPHRPSLRLCHSAWARPVAAATARASCTCVCVCAPQARALLHALLRPPMTAAAAPHARQDRRVWVRARVCARSVCKGSQGIAQRADFGRESGMRSTKQRVPFPVQHARHTRADDGCLTACVPPMASRQTHADTRSAMTPAVRADGSSRSQRYRFDRISSEGNEPSSTKHCALET